MWKIDSMCVCVCVCGGGGGGGGGGDRGYGNPLISCRRPEL